MPRMTEGKVQEWLDIEVKYLIRQVKDLLGDRDARRAKRLLREATRSTSAERRKDS